VDPLDNLQMIYDIVVPDLGATGAEIAISEWLVKPNDFVRAGSPVFTVTTDKAEMEVEAFRDGYIREIVVPAGIAVTPGTVVAMITDSLEASLPGRASAGAPGLGEPGSRSKQPGQVAAPAIVEPASLHVRPSPAEHLRASVPKHTERFDGVVHPADTRPLADSSNSITGTTMLAPTGASLVEMFRRMVLIRRFEDHLYRLFLQGLVSGTLHQCQGQEAVAVGVCSALRQDDVIFSTHRPVGHFIAKGSALRPIAAELWGKATGCAGGKGGQMHLVDMSVGAFPSNAIVGANIPIATGAALGFKLSGVDRIAVSFFGDGAANIGAFHEGINLAAVKDAPVVFVCENNLYAASTHISAAMRITDIAERAAAYGIPGFSVDGMELIAVYESAKQAVERARSGKGPTLLEYKTFRYAGHSRGDPGGYRTQNEVKRWKERDPIGRARALVLQQCGLSEAEIEMIERKCEEEVEDAVEFARTSPDPLPDRCTGHVFASEGATH
jgi:TPP-dependent pyruvate/acetoin dehydrogenase alpha subunit